MSKDPFGIIAANHRETAHAALRAAFGASPVGAIRPVPGGVSGASVSSLTLDEFTHAIRSGRLKPDTFETSHALGNMYLASFLSGDRPPGLPPPLSAFRIEALE